MNDFSSLEKTIVRELSCRLCLCTDVVKLKPLSAEIKRKLKRLFNIVVRADDTLPKAICHDCLQQVTSMNLYLVKVEKTQKFLDFYKMKNLEDKKDPSLMRAQSTDILSETENSVSPPKENPTAPHKPYALSPRELQQGDQTIPNKQAKQKLEKPKKKSPSELKYMEAMSLDEFAKAEKLDKTLLNGGIPVHRSFEKSKKETKNSDGCDYLNESLDPVVLIDGKPAKQGAALDKQITLFYRMECCICHESGFHFRSLMKHYKDRHGVPGYVTCCEKKFHYFYPKKIIEHMAFHLQPNIFMCSSCHQNFPTSQELAEHQSNGGRSEGKVICPRCSERYPTYHELGWHIITHRTDKMQCDYCGKQLKHHHRKKTINRMEDVILCSQCIRTLRNLEKQTKELKEKEKNKSSDALTLQKHQKFRQAMGLSGDEDASTD